MAIEMAREVQHCQLTDLGTINGELPQEYLDAINGYLDTFCKPIREGEGDEQRAICPKCGEQQGGILSMLGLGVGIEWGIAHGEARCTGCGWPYRGMHYIKAKDAKEGDKPLLTIRNLFLAYHPDNVTEGERS